jgi:hypothetical protein
MFDHGTLMLSYTDDVFRYLVNSAPPDYADGDVEAPTGWFAIVIPLPGELAHAVSITGSPRAGEAGVFAPGAAYGVRLDVYGNIWAFEYTDVDPQSDESVYYDFDRAVEEYNQWSARCSYCDTPLVNEDCPNYGSGEHHAVD